MRILRVLLSAPPDPARADAWAVFGPDGRALERGRSVPSAWPPADRREAVLAADAVRVASLALPPLARPRLVAAATYALADRLATSPNDASIAVGERRGDGRVNAVVVARELADALLVASVPFARALAEPELVPVASGWRWCEGPDSGFVRTSDGSAFPVSRSGDDALPPELAMALAQSARDGKPPAEVIADRRVTPSLVAEWERASGVRFRAGSPWHWDDAPPEAYARAIDVLAVARYAAVPAPPAARGYAAALGVAAFALALHVLAAFGTWGWQRIELARVERSLVPLAQQAGARDVNASNAVPAIARSHADARHRAGLSAPGDAMPVLARAAPALTALPSGALKSATWTGGAWTLDLAPLDETALSGFAGRLANAELSALHAKTQSGVRVRLSPAP